MAVDEKVLQILGELDNWMNNPEIPDEADPRVCLLEPLSRKMGFVIVDAEFLAKKFNANRRNAEIFLKWQEEYWVYRDYEFLGYIYFPEANLYCLLLAYFMHRKYSATAEIFKEKHIARFII